MYALAIHGGAGTIAPEELDKLGKDKYMGALEEALMTGYVLLEQGRPAQDAVLAAVTYLEDCPLFNAGRGSVFNHEGKHEMDASIMLGRDLSAGAVAGVSNIKNPILLANKVRTHTEHVMLVGEGAERLARETGVGFMPDDYFYDAYRYEQYQQALKEDKARLDHTSWGDRKWSTVGAVALDLHGHLAAATSTGGLTNKKYGRVGDTPIIGAGTYANNATCAVSCTGHGEYFMKQVAAHSVHTLMLYANHGLKDAAERVVMRDLVDMDGEGGLIAVDIEGNIAMPFNSKGMYRAFQKSNGERWIGIY